MRMRISGEVYNTAALDQLQLKDLLTFNNQVADVGLTYQWPDIERLHDEIDALPKDEARKHPDALFLMAVTVWATLRNAGQPITFDDAISRPMSEIEVIRDPADRKKAGPTSGARKAPAKKATTRKSPARRPASAPAVAAAASTPPE